MTEGQSFWDNIFRGISGHYSEERERKVLEYVMHRVREGGHLRDILQEEYVRRYASQDEIYEILENPKLIEAAHEQMREDFTSGELDPKSPPR